MNIHDAIVQAYADAEANVRAYGDQGRDMSEHYADAVLARVKELASIDDVEAVITERHRYKRALEYIATTPVRTEEEMVMQGHATLAIAGRAEEKETVE